MFKNFIDNLKFQGVICLGRINTSISSITVNENMKIVTVVFEDGDVQMSKCTEDDKFDINVGVAMCIAYHLYGSKSKFHKEVESKASYAKPRRQLKEAQKEQETQKASKPKK